MTHVAVFTANPGLDRLKYCQAHKGLKIHAYVIMPSHIHAIISHETINRIPAVIRDFKHYTSKQIKNFLSQQGQFSNLFWVKVFQDKESSRTRIWQKGYHPVAIISQIFFTQKLGYIHANPVRKGFVEQPENWKYSSARNYLLGDNSLIDIDAIL